MNVSFVLLLAAAIILRYVAKEAGAVFEARVAGLLPRKVLEGHLQTLFDEYRLLLPLFRLRALPFSALEISLNAVASAVVVAALWTYPAGDLSQLSIFLLRYCSAAFLLLTVLGDLFEFGRLCYFSFSRDDEDAGETGEA